MERTRSSKEVVTNEQLMTFASQLVSRVSLMSRLGMQYDGDRDVYKALGYPTGELKYKDFYNRYIRQDMAKAIIDRPVRATWQGPLELIESDKSEDTAFEKAWVDLNRKHGIKSKLSRLDRLTGIGRYGVLLLGLDDVPNREAFAKEVKGGARTLKYVKPFSEETAKISKFETDPKNERYGLPLLYELEVADIDSGASAFVEVHYSRIIHVTDESLESDVYGTPRLEAVYNRLMDLDKLIGADAEMFWRGARPGYEGKVDPDYQMSAEALEALKDQVDEYENNLRRILINEGIELKALAQQIADPSSHVDAVLKMISSVTGIPLRVLTGSERGELASTQDTSEWKEYVQARREDHADTNIVRPLVDRLIALKILPKPANDYVVKWNDLYSLSEKALVEIGKARATALREYIQNPLATEVVPPNAFFEFFLGLTTEKITLINKMRADGGEEELKEMIEAMIMGPETEDTSSEEDSEGGSKATPKIKKKEDE